MPCALKSFMLDNTEKAISKKSNDLQLTKKQYNLIFNYEKDIYMQRIYLKKLAIAIHFIFHFTQFTKRSTASTTI